MQGGPFLTAGMQPFGTATEGGNKHWRAENITSMFEQELSEKAFSVVL